MLNLFLSYIYSPSLSSEIYDGFLYNRGCKSWWEKLLWSPLLEKYPYIMELDFSSGFPNLNLHSVKAALLSDGLVPPYLVQLLLHHLKSPQRESPTFPTLESYIENEENKSWRSSDRSVPMGLGICPILYVITQRWAYQQVPLLNLVSIQHKKYADDISSLFTRDWINSFLLEIGRSYSWFCAELTQGRNPILTYFNDLPLFQEVGLKFCLKKSGFVKFEGIWHKEYKSLGLSLYTKLSRSEQITLTQQGVAIPLNLKGSTRGRGANPVTGQSATEPSHEELEYYNHSKTGKLDLEKLILSYRPYFGLLMSKLYSTSLTASPHSSKLSSDPWSLLGILMKKNINKLLPKTERYTLYNSGSKLTLYLLQLIKGEGLKESLVHNLTNEKLRLKWTNIEELIIKEDEILRSNPLKTLNSRYTWEKEYYKKYSELKIQPEVFQQYTKDYELRKPKTNKNPTE